MLDNIMIYGYFFLNNIISPFHFIIILTVTLMISNIVRYCEEMMCIRVLQ